MVVGAAAAIYEQAVVKSERLSRAGWIQPSIRRHSSLMKRHFSYCGA